MIFNAFLLALREISRNLMRSTLTILGIVIGVAAVVTMVTLGNGATASISQQISTLGSNLIIVRTGQRMTPGSNVTAPPFKLEDALRIQSQVPNVAGVAPMVSTSVTSVAASKNWRTIAHGTTGSYLQVGNWQLAAGRNFTDSEERTGKAVCIVGDRVRRELYGNDAPLGDNIRIQKFGCQIIGFLKVKGQSATGNDQDDVVLMPLRTVQRRITGNENIGSILISARSNQTIDDVKNNVESLMRDRRNISEDEENNFNVMDTRQITQALSGTTKIMTLLLGAVAAVSLLVGGIGIMNIMLVSVTERTREIGIRLAIGALEREVLSQFLVEAVVLSSAGGLAGILLATIASVGLSNLMSLPYHFDWQINLFSFCFSALIGIIFGFMPARRAARLNPIDALRHE